jgi:hypothetical protein
MVDGSILLRVQCLTDDALSMRDLMGEGGVRTGELEGPDVDCSFHQANINKILLSSKKGVPQRHHGSFPLLCVWQGYKNMITIESSPGGD